MIAFLVVAHFFGGRSTDERLALNMIFILVMIILPDNDLFLSIEHVSSCMNLYMSEVLL